MVLEGPDLSACTCSQDACDAGRAACRILSAPTQPCPAPSLCPTTPSRLVPQCLFHVEGVSLYSGTALAPAWWLSCSPSAQCLPFGCFSVMLDSTSFLVQACPSPSLSLNSCASQPPVFGPDTIQREVRPPTSCSHGYHD